MLKVIKSLGLMCLVDNLDFATDGVITEQVLSKSAWDHSLSTHATFSEKITLLPPDTHTCVCVSEGKKY